MTAIEIQHALLETVEGHLGAPFLPPWAESVCRVWRSVLEALGADPRRLDPVLDWRIKRVVLTSHLERRGVTWDWLEEVNRKIVEMAGELRERRGGGSESALARWRRYRLAMPRHARLHVLFEERRLGRLRPFLRRVGLAAGELETFLDLREELFEIDTRFADVGAGGIFRRLDAAGAIADAVADSIDDPAGGLDGGGVLAVGGPPPPGTRAEIRGRLVRSLSPVDRDRYRCSWQLVLDTRTKRHVDLGHPFATDASWKELPAWGSPFVSLLAASVDLDSIFSCGPDADEDVEDDPDEDIDEGSGGDLPF